jgi:hypothetical protein
MLETKSTTAKHGMQRIGVAKRLPTMQHAVVSLRQTISSCSPVIIVRTLTACVPMNTPSYAAAPAADAIGIRSGRLVVNARQYVVTQ